MLLTEKFLSDDLTFTKYLIEIALFMYIESEGQYQYKIR